MQNAHHRGPAMSYVTSIVVEISKYMITTAISIRKERSRISDKTGGSYMSK